MTDAQTEARAIQRYIAPSAGRGAVVQLLKHCDGEWVRYEDHATALAAKDAELAESWEARAEQWRLRRETENARDMMSALATTFRAERDEARAQLAEANKARNYLKDAVTVGLSDSEISRRAKLFIAAVEQGGE
jgi:hypothetical protein